MTPIDQQPQEDRTLQQSCLKLILFLAVPILLMMTVVAPLALITRLPEKVFGVSVTLLLRLWGLVAGIGCLVSMLYFTRWMLSGMRQRYERSGEILQRTLPDLPVKQESEVGEQLLSKKRWTRLILLLPFFFLLIGALRWATHEGLMLIWVDAPGWIQEVIEWTVLIGSSLIIRRSFNRRYGRQRTPTTSLKEIRWVAFIPPFLLLSVLLVGSFSMISTVPILGIPVSSLFLPLLLAYILGPYRWVMIATERGNYDRALRRVQIAEKFSMSRSMYLDMHGHILWRAGRYIEAEQVLRTEILETRREGGSGVLTLNTLGYVLMGQGKWEEAIRVFEGAIALEPNEGSLYDSLADVYLSQGIETDKALELLDQALAKHQSSWFKRWSRRRSLSATWAGRAWTLARLGRRAEATESLEKAFTLAPREHNADSVEILYRAGHALALLGETQKAAEHFAEAQRLDPHGHYGRLCAEAAARLQE